MAELNSQETSLVNPWTFRYMYKINRHFHF